MTSQRLKSSEPPPSGVQRDEREDWILVIDDKKPQLDRLKAAFASSSLEVEFCRSFGSLEEEEKKRTADNARDALRRRARLPAAIVTDLNVDHGAYHGLDFLDEMYARARSESTGFWSVVVTADLDLTRLRQRISRLPDCRVKPIPKEHEWAASAARYVQTLFTAPTGDSALASINPKLPLKDRVFLYSTIDGKYAGLPEALWLPESSSNEADVRRPALMHRGVFTKIDKMNGLWLAQFLLRWRLLSREIKAAFPVGFLTATEIARPPEVVAEADEDVADADSEEKDEDPYPQACPGPKFRSLDNVLSDFKNKIAPLGSKLCGPTFLQSLKRMKTPLDPMPLANTNQESFLAKIHFVLDSVDATALEGWHRWRSTHRTDESLQR